MIYAFASATGRAYLLEAPNDAVACEDAREICRKGRLFRLTDEISEIVPGVQLNFTTEYDSDMHVTNIRSDKY